MPPTYAVFFLRSAADRRSNAASVSDPQNEDVRSFARLIHPAIAGTTSKPRLVQTGSLAVQVARHGTRLNMPPKPDGGAVLSHTWTLQGGRCSILLQNFRTTR